MALSPIVIIVLLIGLCLSIFLTFVALWSRHRKACTGNFIILGMRARVTTTLEPEGAIILDGELWRAQLFRSTSRVMPGKVVRVVGVNGHYLVVEPTE